MYTEMSTVNEYQKLGKQNHIETCIYGHYVKNYQSKNHKSGQKFPRHLLTTLDGQTPLQHPP